MSATPAAHTHVGIRPIEILEELSQEVAHRLALRRAAKNLFRVEEREVDELARVIAADGAAIDEALDEMDHQQERGEARRVEAFRH